MIKAHTPEGRASYSFENGYGEYLYSIGSMKMCFWERGGTDPVPEYFAVPGHDDPCLGIAYVKIGDLFCGEFDRVPVSDLGSIADFEYVGTRERGGVETVHEWVSEFRYSSVPSFRVIIMHDDHDFIDAAAEASVSPVLSEKGRSLALLPSVFRQPCGQFIRAADVIFCDFARSARSREACGHFMSENRNIAAPRITRTTPVARLSVFGSARFANTAAILAHMNVNTMHRTSTVISGVSPIAKWEIAP